MDCEKPPTTPERPSCFEPYEAPTQVLEHLAQVQAEKLAKLAGAPSWYFRDELGPQCVGGVAIRCRQCGTRWECASESEIPPHCGECVQAGLTPDQPHDCRTHQPIDFADFELMVCNLREWLGWPDKRMAIGECIDCASSITCAIPDGVDLGDAVDCAHCEDRRMVTRGKLPDGRVRWVVCLRCGGEGDVASRVESTDIERAIPITGVDLGGTEAPSWLKIPRGIQGDLTRYIEHRQAPGGFVRALMVGDLFGMMDAAVDDEARRAIPDCAEWVQAHAPGDCHGSAYAVEAWIVGLGG